MLDVWIARFSGDVDTVATLLTERVLGQVVPDLPPDCSPTDAAQALAQLLPQDDLYTRYADVDGRMDVLWDALLMAEAPRPVDAQGSAAPAAAPALAKLINNATVLHAGAVYAMTARMPRLLTWCLAPRASDEATAPGDGFVAQTTALKLLTRLMSQHDMVRDAVQTQLLTSADGSIAVACWPALSETVRSALPTPESVAWVSAALRMWSTLLLRVQEWPDDASSHAWLLAAAARSVAAVLQQSAAGTLTAAITNSQVEAAQLIAVVPEDALRAWGSSGAADEELLMAALLGALERYATAAVRASSAIHSHDTSDGAAGACASSAVPAAVEVTRATLKPLLIATYHAAHSSQALASIAYTALRVPDPVPMGWAPTPEAAGLFASLRACLQLLPPSPTIQTLVYDVLLAMHGGNVHRTVRVLGPLGIPLLQREGQLPAELSGLASASGPVPS